MIHTCTTCYPHALTRGQSRCWGCAMVRSTVLTLAWVLVCLAHPAWAVDRTAASCSSAAVQATIDASANGDGVIVPAGNCTWTAQVTTKQKALRIVGNNPNPTLPAQGSDGTVVITGSSPGGSVTAYFVAYEATSINVEISNLTFVQAGTGSENPSSGGGFVFVSHVVGGKPVSFHHNTYITHQCGPTRGIATTYNRGVYWRNKFLSDVPLAPCGWLNTVGALALYPNIPDGTALYNSPTTLGALDTNGDQHLYFETNYMENMSNQALDSQDGSRMVIRYNTFVDSSIGNHGHDSGPIGTRQWEVYNNTFILTDRGNDTANIGRWIMYRGGTGVITDNIIPLLNVPGFGGVHPDVHALLFALYQDQC